MTVLYQVKFTHTHQLIWDYSVFREKAKGGGTIVRGLLYALVMFTTARFIKDMSRLWIACVALGVLFLFLTLIRRPVLVHNLKKRNPYYLDQTPITLEFGEKEFNLQEGDKKQTIRYGELTDIYEDKRNYYLCINNEDLHILAKKSFTKGDPDKFGVFIQDKAEKTIIPLNPSLQQRLEDFKAKIANSRTVGGQ